MRRFSRQIEVFDISLMAVVTKAMGAFLVLFVLVLPFYTGDPNIKATSQAAREEIAQLKRALEALAGQIHADPDQERALREAIRRMQAMVDEGDAKINQLSRQAEALSSQLRRAQADLGEAKKERDAAREESKQAQLGAAELEVLANRYDRNRRSAMTANADGEQVETAERNALNHAAFATRTLVVDAWSWKSDCPRNGVSVFVLNDSDKPPEGVDIRALGDFGNTLIQRVSIADLTVPLGQPKAGEPRKAVRASPVWQGDGGRGIIVAHVPRPSAVSCRIDVSTTSTDVATLVSKTLEQRDVELPASTEFVLLAGYDYTTSSVRLSVPIDDDRALWNKSKDKVSKSCAMNTAVC